MNNNQYPPTNFITPTNYQPHIAKPSNPNKTKFTIMLISLISIMVIGLIVLISLIISKNQSPLTTAREATPTLQIYADLPDEMPIKDIEKTAQRINKGAVVTLNEGYGTIKIPDAEDLISFYYLYEDEEGEEQTNSEIEDTDEGLPGEEDAETSYQPDTAYDFTYLYEMGEYNLYISRVEDNLYQCYDGIDVFEFSSKQEAINAFLAPSAE